MPTIRSGAVGAAGDLAVNQSLRVVEMRDKIYHLEPAATPLTMLLNKVSKEASDNPKFEWTEDEAKPITDTVNGTFTTTTLTTFAVDNGSYFHAHDIIKDQNSGEVMLVTAVSTNTLSVTRNVFGTSPAEIIDGANLLIMGSAFPENHAGPGAVEVVTASKYNYTQIFRDRFGVSATVQASKLYGGDKLAYLQKVRGIDHAKGIEMAMFFGERSSDETIDDGNYGRRTTGGINQIISTNATDVGSGWASSALATTGPLDFRYGSDTKLLFCSLAGAAKIASVASATGYLELAQGESTFGLKITKLVAAAGTYLIVPHKLFINEYADMAIVVDMDQVAFRYLNGRDTKLRTNVQSPGVDGRMDEYLSEVGLERRLEKVHGRWTDVVA